MGTTAIRYLYYEEPPEVGPGGIGVNPSNYKVSYSPLEASSSSVNVRVNEGGVAVTPQITSMAISWGDGIFRNLIVGQDYLGMSVSRQIENSQVVVGFNFIQGASFQGTVVLNLAYRGNPMSVTIDVAPDAVLVSVDCDIPSLSYNTSESSWIIFNANLTLNGEPAEMTKWSAKFISADETVDVTSSRYRGVLFTYDNGHFVLFYNVGATFKGCIQLTLESGDYSRDIVIPVIRVENGKDGKDGPMGIRGPYIRGPRDWSKIKNEANDSEYFFSGAEGEAFIDVVYCPTRFYVCISTHKARQSQNPTTIQGALQWVQFSSYDYLATKLFLAERAKIQNLIAEGIEMRDDDNNVIFYVAKDGEGNSYVYASKGTFENVSVKGDIQCNTQTYAANMQEDPYPLTGAQNPTSNRITISPEGGCIIIPPGKSDMVVLLPEVEEGTVRQVTVINQRLPHFGAANTRDVIFKCGTENVWIFPQLNDYTSAIHSTNAGDMVPVDYGAYNLYGYRMGIYFGGPKDVTVWSMWKTDVAYTLPTYDPFTPTPAATINGFTKTPNTGLPTIPTL